MEAILNSIEKSHPDCTIIGLGFFDPIYRKAPFTDQQGIPTLPIETDHSGRPKYVPMFLPFNLVRAEMSALNEIKSVGGIELPSPTPVDPAGPASVSNKDWTNALRECARGDTDIILGEDRDPGSDVCNQEAYVLTKKGWGGFFHISDCEKNTVLALKRMVTCLQERFSP